MATTVRRARAVRPVAAPTLREHLVAFVRELCIVVIGALVVSALVRVLVGQVFDIPSESMSPTLAVGDRVLVEKLTPLERGQVVVFHDPGGWLTPPAVDPGPVRRAVETIGLAPAASSDHVVKRVVGLPGDRVHCCEARGWLVVNGVALDETYLGQPASAIVFTVVVPAGHVFVLGDNRSRSRDSRCHLNDPGPTTGQNAFIPIDRIVGRAAAVTWPMSRWRGVDSPPAYREVPAPAAPAPTIPSITAGPEARC